MYVTYKYVLEKGCDVKEKAKAFIEGWNLLDDAQSLMNLLSRRVQMQYDLTPQELRVLLELDQNSKMNISELAKAINRDFGNVSRTCSTLVKRGILNRQRADDDHRVTIITLTAEGKEKLNIFYQCNLIVMQDKIQKQYKDKYETMMLEMKLFISSIAKEMEEIDD